VTPTTINTWLSAHQDKMAHYIGGGLLAVVSIPFGFWWSIGLVALVATGKEAWDHFNPPHQGDVWDALATVLGGLPIWLVQPLCKQP